VESFGSSEPATGEKDGEYMKTKITYTNEPLGEIHVVPDFLPAPKDLVFRNDGVKVTLALTRRSVDFFKAQARKQKGSYQRMIRHLLDAYAAHHSQNRMTSDRSRRSGRRSSV
jgi:hypothetical protein